MTRPLLAAVLAALLAGPAVAHGIWIEESHGALAVVYGHGATNEAYEPARVTSLLACDAAGTCSDAAPTVLDTHVELARPEGAATLAATFDNGLWTQGADGEWLNVPRAAVAGATASGRYLKYATVVLDHLDGEAVPAGLALEIVPLADPLAMVAGDELPVRVLFEGQPLAGAEVTVDYVGDAGADPVIADAEGVARVPLRNNGLNVLAVSHTGPGVEADATDETGHIATLAFTLHSHDD